jgi:hypothetical protein
MIYELNDKYSNQEYFSERVPQILGSKGLLMTNSYLKNNLEKDIDYIYIDKNIDWFGKIMEIKNNTEEYDIMRNNGYNKGIKYYQWSEFAKQINEITLG